MKHNHPLLRPCSASRNRSFVILTLVFYASVPRQASPADDRAAVSTINHAFATELGTGFYDIGGRSVFLFSFTPGVDVRAADSKHPGIRLVVPMSAGSFDFVPDDAIGGDLPDRIDSYSIAPGFEFDFLLRRAWILTPWARAGMSFTGGASDGVVWGTGARLNRDVDLGELAITQRHEAGLVTVKYEHQRDDRFLRLRNALDLQYPTLPLSARHRLLLGFYGILDVVPDPPAAPEDVKPTVVQFEVGMTFNGHPRPKLGPLNWPRLGVGYRFAGQFSGWRIVLGAPF
jgi:hypothetical protein